MYGATDAVTPGKRRRAEVDIVIRELVGFEEIVAIYSRNAYADDGLIMVKLLSAWAKAEFPEYAAHKLAM
jgi:hypothetical protein